MTIAVVPMRVSGATSDDEGVDWIQEPTKGQFRGSSRAGWRRAAPRWGLSWGMDAPSGHQTQPSKRLFTSRLEHPAQATSTSHGWKSPTVRTVATGDFA